MTATEYREVVATLLHLAQKTDIPPHLADDVRGVAAKLAAEAETLDPPLAHGAEPWWANGRW